MSDYMIMVIVPYGHSDKVIQGAIDMGATGATVIRARGVDKAAKEGLFSFKVEPEEEIVLIMACQETTEKICNGIHDNFKMNTDRSGSVYILPIKKHRNEL